MLEKLENIENARQIWKMPEHSKNYWKSSKIEKMLENLKRKTQKI